MNQALIFPPRPPGRRRFHLSDMAADGYDTLVLNEQSFTVRRHWFWPEYANNWEEDTWRFYDRFARPDRTAIDLGSWIGPTVLFAARAGVQRILAVEGNPRTVEHLASTRAANPGTLSGLVLVNAVLAARPGLVEFGNADGSQATSSASSTRGKGFRVQGVTIDDLLASYDAGEPCIMKIDIEGSELELAEQIASLRRFSAAALLLSLHPPFWPAPIDEAARIMVSALTGYEIWSVAGERLDADTLQAMIAYQGHESPAWGTPFGNFFEVVLLPR